MSIKGQIIHGSLFCSHIHNTISRYKPKNILEIGTWKGLGSTKCIIDAIISNNLKCNFISIESNPQFFLEAKENLQNYREYVDLVYGRIVEVSDVMDYVRSIQDLVNTD